MKHRPKDITYSATCGCVVTLYAATEYYDHRFNACAQHADRFNAGRAQILADAKAEVERVVAKHV